MTARLSAQDLRQVLKVGQNALQGRQVDEVGRQVLADVEPAFQAEILHFWTASGPEVMDFSSVIYSGVDDTFAALYRTDYFRNRNPWFSGPFGGYFLPEKTTVLLLEDFMPRREWDQSEFYNELQRPHGLYHEILVFLVADRNPVGVLSIMRHPQDPEFTSQDKAKAQLMAPYLAAAMDKAIASQHVAERNLILDNLLDTYGATSEAEFFAVATEQFFDQPALMVRHAPELYRVLKEYYRQDPVARLG